MRLLICCLTSILIWVLACSEDQKVDTGDLSKIPYSPEAYPMTIPAGLHKLPDSIIASLTKEGVQLGRHLFYDAILSSDSTMACATCHNPHKGFTDNFAVSKGVTGMVGNRSAMTVLNAVYANIYPGYFNVGMFWDGREPDLQAQAVQPVQNPIEMHEIWPNVILKLKKHAIYPEMFRKAFGISSKDQITKELATKAIAQFETILLTGGNSIFQKQRRGTLFFEADQQEGHDLYFNQDPMIPDAQCFHCHSEPLMMGTNDYFNNGIDSVKSLDDFADKGRGGVTHIRFDNGKFKAPSLYNIELTGPYMHDGRFKTLEEVIDHYNSGGHVAENKNAFILPLGLNSHLKKSLLAFLKTLTDTTYLQNPDVLSPF